MSEPKSINTEEGALPRSRDKVLYAERQRRDKSKGVNRRPLTEKDKAYMARLSARGVTSTAILRHMWRKNIDATPYDVNKLPASPYRGQGPIKSYSFRMHEELYERLRTLAKSLGYEWSSSTGHGYTGSIPMFLNAVANGYISIDVNDGEEPEKWVGQDIDPDDKVVPRNAYGKQGVYRDKVKMPAVNWYPNERIDP